MASGLQSLDLSEKDLKLKLPSGSVVSGATMSGKSTFLEKVVANSQEMFEPPPKCIIYAYGGDYHDRVGTFQRLGAVIVAGLPSDEVINRCEKPALLILDDLMGDAKSSYLTDLYTKKVHHKNLGVMFVTQNLYEKNLKVARDNSQYLFLLKAPMTRLQIRTIGTQLFPGQLNYFLDAFDKATDEGDESSYLMIDAHPRSKRVLKLRSNIFPQEEHTVFLPIQS